MASIVYAVILCVVPSLLPFVATSVVATCGSVRCRPQVLASSICPTPCTVVDCHAAKVLPHTHQSKTPQIAML